MNDLGGVKCCQDAVRYNTLFYLISLMIWSGLIFWPPQVGASLCYTVGAVFARRNLDYLEPVVLAAGQMMTATLFTVVGALVLERPLYELTHASLLGYLSVLWLGIPAVGLGFLIYYILLQAWNATRVSMVTYASPIVGVVFGVILLREPADLRLVLGLVLIPSGIFLVNKQAFVNHADRG